MYIYEKKCIYIYILIYICIYIYRYLSTYIYIYIYMACSFDFHVFSLQEVSANPPYVNKVLKVLWLQGDMNIESSNSATPRSMFWDITLW